MTRINLCFEVHQPLRLRAHFNPDVKSENLIEHYFDVEQNRHIFNRIANKCYLPANHAILNAIENLGKKFRVTYSMSGVFIDQCEMFNPDVLESFRQLADTGCVEFLGQTYYHSLASLWGNDREEFAEQVEMHREKIKDVFGQRPMVFENTELLYNNMIAKTVAGLGFRGIFAEGCDHILGGWKSQNYLYTPPGHLGTDIKVFLRNYKLSDDVGYRFSARWWEEWPLTAEKYASWLAATPGDLVNIFIDYETFGEHHWADSGIMWFLGSLPFEATKWKNLKFTTPKRCLILPARGEVDVFEYKTTSWADMERDTSAWLGNRMQQQAFEEIKSLKYWMDISGSDEMKKAWRYLQNSDHLYYLCTKSWGDGDVHCYFSPFGTAEDGFYTLHRIMSDMKWKVANRIA